MKTVDNPKTNDRAIKVTEKVLEFDGLLLKLATDEPAINARYGGTIGNTHGDKKLRIPAEKAIKIDIANEASNSSWPNIIFPFPVQFLRIFIRFLKD
tara:strand:- start:662 stop:952 length:291 start_codon:yes stop_codon:yes gene_type:complete